MGLQNLHTLTHCGILSSMKKTRSPIFGICIAVVYFLTIALFGASLVLLYQEGNTRWDDRFNEIVRKTASVSAIAEPGTEQFNRGLTDALSDIDNIAALQILSGNNLIISYPANIEDVPSGTSLFLRPKSTKINTRTTTLTINASIYLLTPEALLQHCAIAFFIILAATVALIVYMVSLPTDPVEVQEERTVRPVTKPVIQESTPHMEVQTAQPDSFTDDYTEPVKPVTKEEPEQKPVLQQSPEPKAETTADTETQKTVSEESGLFSPATGFGWQAYMKPRLESELERAAAADIDLTLMTVHVPGLVTDNPAKQDLIKAILEIAGFNDLVFEDGNDGCSVIMGYDIDTALKRAEELYDKLERELAYENLTCRPAIGLSSRSLRLISAERLSNESQMALKHAMNEEGKRIIAFRVNPDKYRNFLAGEVQ